MQNKILTIIVPSYNMEKYLPKCLGSLVVAPELMEQLEVQVVNDGSKDRTSEIAHEFAAKWPQTFKVIDKANGNYGSCINAALPVATGKYVKVLDADDWFETAAFAEYLRFLDGVGDVDLIVTDYDTVDENGCVTKQHGYEFDPEKEFSIEEFVASKSYLPMHALTYRTELLREMGYRQLEGVSYTDTEWSSLPLARVRTVRYFPNVVYKYLLGRAGQTMAVEKVAKSWWMRGAVVLDMVEKAMPLFRGSMSVNVRRVLAERVNHFVEVVYRGALVGYQGESVNFDLPQFDKRLKAMAPELYEKLNDVVYSGNLPYRFIHGWRRNSFLFPFALGMCKVYSRLLKIVRR